MGKRRDEEKLTVDADNLTHVCDDGSISAWEKKKTIGSSRVVKTRRGTEREEEKGRIGRRGVETDRQSRKKAGDGEDGKLCLASGWSLEAALQPL